MKLRRYTTNFELSRMFNVSENSVKILFSHGLYSWLNSGERLIYGHQEILRDISIHQTLNQSSPQLESLLVELNVQLKSQKHLVHSNQHFQHIRIRTQLKP